MTLGIGVGALIAGLFGMNVRLPDHAGKCLLRDSLATKSLGRFKVGLRGDVRCCIGFSGLGDAGWTAPVCTVIEDQFISYLVFTPLRCWNVSVLTVCRLPSGSQNLEKWGFRPVLAHLLVDRSASLGSHCR